LIHILNFNFRDRNYGRASREHSPCNLAQCLGDGVLGGLSRARTTEGKGRVEVPPTKLTLRPQNFDTDLVIDAEDTDAEFLLAGPDAPVADRELRLGALRETWNRRNTRQHVDDSEWSSDLAQFLTHLVDLRTAHVDKWLKSNVQRFQAGHASIEELRRTFDGAVIDLRASVQLCRSQCSNCNLFCIQSRLHEGSHDCLTNHECVHACTFCERDYLAAKPCGQM
jgi:hypothetical protein